MIKQEEVQFFVDGVNKLWSEIEDEDKRIALSITFFDRHGLLRPAPPRSKDDFLKIIREHERKFAHEGIPAGLDRMYWHNLVMAGMFLKLSKELYETIVEAYCDSGVLDL